MTMLDMKTRAADDFRWPGLLKPDGEAIRMNHQDFVAVDRARDATYDAIYRPQALYNVATAGLRANNDAFLLQEVATNLPIYRPDTGPTDFHLHLPPGGFQLVVVTSGMFTFDYDGKIYYVGPGAVMLQSAIVHRQLFYTWSGLSTEDNLKTSQTVVPDSVSMGYSGKFLEAFITEPSAFPNPTVVSSDHIKEDETPRYAWSHPLHNRPAGASFWLQDPLEIGAAYRPLAAAADGSAIKSHSTVYVRDLEIDGPSGQLVTGHILATDPRERPILPKGRAPAIQYSAFTKGDVAVYRVIRGTAEFKDSAGKTLELSTGDTVTAGKNSLTLVGIGDDTQVLRLGLLKGIERLSRWSAAQRDDIDGLAGQIITRQRLRPMRTEGDPVGFLYD